MQQSILLLHSQQALACMKSGVQYSIMSIKLIEIPAAAAAKVSMLHFSQLARSNQNQSKHSARVAGNNVKKGGTVSTTAVQSASTTAVQSASTTAVAGRKRSCRPTGCSPDDRRWRLQCPQHADVLSLYKLLTIMGLLAVRAPLPQCNCH